MYNRHHGCGPGGWGRRGFFHSSPINITESETGYIIRLYAPGLEKENISVTTHRDMLTIKYTAKEAGEPKENFTRREYRPENIERNFDLKGKVDIDAIRSTYNEGILTVELPKTEAAQRPAKSVNVM